jgi:hypothetical protein
LSLIVISVSACARTAGGKSSLFCRAIINAELGE